MSTGTRHIEIAPARRWGRGHAAIALGVVAVVLSFVAWDWFAWGGVVLVVPVAIAAAALGVRARRAGGAARALGTVAIGLAAIVVLIPVAWTIAGIG
jgi:hypothetical protein